MILIIDNYDSFVYNLYQYLGDLGAEPLVVRNDKISIEEVERLAPERIVLSPGPGHPANRRDFGVCTDILGAADRPRFPAPGSETQSTKPEIPNSLKGLPVLGVCLGHQGIIAHFGGKVVRSAKPMHGKTSEISHDGSGLFKGVKNPLRVMRYHSLVGTGIPDCLEVAARSREDDAVMAVRHKTLPIYGVQFHPESIMTEDGKRMLENFLRA